LVPDVDYTIGIENTDSIILLTPAEGVWINGTYTITIDNSADPIKDLAGNNLQPNQQSGLTQFTIELTDTPVSVWQNHENPLDVNADGVISGLDALLVINRLLLGMAGELPAIPAVPPYIDTTGDGILSPRDALLVINLLSLRSTAAPASASVAPAAAQAEPSTVEPLASEPLASEPAASPATTSEQAPEPTLASSAAVAFGVTIAGDMSQGPSFASTSVDVTGASWSESVDATTTLAAPWGADSAAVADDVWGSDTWDPSSDELDGIVSELFDDSDERDLAVV
jgi:hypothetical protein